MRLVRKAVFALPALALASVVSTTALAQQSGQQIVVIEGLLFDTSIPALVEYEPPLEFRAEVGENLDTASPVSEGGENGAIYKESTFRISVQVFRSEGEVVFEQELTTPTPGDFTDFGQIALFSFGMASEQEFESDPGSAFWGLASINDFGYVAHEVRLGGGFYVEGREGPMGEESPGELTVVSPDSLFVETTYYPMLRTGETSYPFSFRSIVVGDSIGVLSNEGSTSYQEGYMNGMATNISYADLDSDGDGIADAVDKCSPSVLTENVEFGGIDTGVMNATGDDGCTLMDRYAKCKADAEEQSSPLGLFQPVYSGPSYCEKQVAYQAVSEGLIGYGDARVLRTELYNFYRNGGDY
ncbi:hypothetical protein ACQ5ES_05855 [Pseudidiomarina sp. E22-M8]|uniref:hypothetical protein n=1 Tax=Pseudidiomarina sp. E22-M8 TaxID=3424768 RepID=UPI00403CF346